MRKTLGVCGCPVIRAMSSARRSAKKLAGSAISGARFTYKWQGENAPLRRNVTLDDVGGGALYLLSDLSAGVTGEVMHVDSGYHTIGMAAPPAD